MLALSEADFSNLKVDESDRNWLDVTINSLKNDSKTTVFTLLSTTKSLLEKREESRYKLVEQILDILTSDEK